jgi:hypothetical protein
VMGSTFADRYRGVAGVLNGGRAPLPA